MFRLVSKSGFETSGMDSGHRGLGDGKRDLNLSLLMYSFNLNPALRSQLGDDMSTFLSLSELGRVSANRQEWAVKPGGWAPPPARRQQLHARRYVKVPIAEVNEAAVRMVVLVFAFCMFGMLYAVWMAS